MRGIAYRRFTQDIIVRRRLKKFFINYWRYTDLHGYIIQNPKWTDSIGSASHHFYKSHTTDPQESKFKTKYSPNKSFGYNRDTKKSGESTGRREVDKRLLLKVLKENGIR